MTGTEPAAPARDTDDRADVAPSHVDPPEGLSESPGDEAQSGEAPSEGDGDVAPTGQDVLDRS